MIDDFDLLRAWRVFGEYRITAEGYLWCDKCAEYASGETWTDDLSLMVVIATEHNNTNHPGRMTRRSQ